MNALTHSDRLFLKSLTKYFRDEALKIFDDIFGTKRYLLEGAYISIDGDEKHDMYDHAPGLATFSVPTTRTLVTKATDVDSLRTSALVHLDSRYDNYRDGRSAFMPRNVRIMHRNGQTLGRFDGRTRTWFEDFVAQHEWHDIERTIADLLELARDDRRWDNHESATRLELRANQLKENLEISRFKARYTEPSLHMAS